MLSTLAKSCTLHYVLAGPAAFLPPYLQLSVTGVADLCRIWIAPENLASEIRTLHYPGYFLLQVLASTLANITTTFASPSNSTAVMRLGGAGNDQGAGPSTGSSASLSGLLSEFSILFMSHFLLSEVSCKLHLKVEWANKEAVSVLRTSTSKSSQGNPLGYCRLLVRLQDLLVRFKRFVQWCHPAFEEAEKLLALVGISIQGPASLHIACAMQVVCKVDLR